MSLSLSSVTIAGNVGADPEMKYTPTGKAVTSFRVAVNSWDSVEKAEITAWFSVTCWDKLAETVANQVKKGSPVIVIGNLDFDKKTGGPRVYTRKDGTAGSTFEVTARELRFGFLPKDSE